MSGHSPRGKDSSWDKLEVEDQFSLGELWHMNPPPPPLPFRLLFYRSKEAYTQGLAARQKQYLVQFIVESTQGSDKSWIGESDVPRMCRLKAWVLPKFTC